MTLRQRMAAARAACVSIVLLLGAALPALAANLPAGFQETLVVSGRTQPTAIRFAPNGHVFVAEKSGMLWLYEGLSDASPTLVVDLRTQTHNFWDRGMVGVAVSPNYPADPSVYVTYTFDAYADGTYPRWGVEGQTADNCPTPPGATANGCVVYGRLSRITVNQTTLQGTEGVLLTGNWCNQYPSHSINDVMFGTDGYLYLAAGDGANFSGGVADYGQLGGNPCGDPVNEGGSLRVQDILTPGDPTSFDGSVLRLDVSGGGIAAAPGNPLVGNGVADDDYVIAIGMRNPFRMAQRPGTPEMWLSDVGWGTWEEINVIPSPATPVENFGWPCYEGGNGVNNTQGSFSSRPMCQNLATGNIPAGIQLRASHYAYLHSATVRAGDGCGTGGSSVTGMAFNNSGGANQYPAEYAGALFFADSTRQCAWTMFPGVDGVPNRNTIEVLVSQASGRIVDLQMGPDGYLYYVDFDGGRVYRISYYPLNAPPSAVFIASPANGPAPLTVQFNAGSSSDPEDGTALTFAWDLDGDGQFDDASGPTPSYVYTQPAVYTVSLRVTDSGNLSDTESLLINAGGSPPTVTITGPSAGTTWAVDDLLSFSGEARDSNGNLLPASELQWDIILHHCYTVDNCHTHPVTSFVGVDSGTFNAPDHEYPSFLNIKLTANPLPPDWFDAAWTRRIKLTIDNSGQAESLTDFPLLVTINNARINYGDANPDGSDVRFTDAAGNPLAYEVERWNPGGTSHVWVRVPSVQAGSSSGYIYMYYGNDAAAAADNPALVWGGYGAVWHLDGDAMDSTANGNHGTQSATTTTAGRMGNSLFFNGAAYVDILNPVGLAITGTLTGEAWIKITDPNQAGNPRIFDKKASPWTSSAGYTLQYKPGQNNITGLGGGSDLLRAEPIDLDTDWHYLVTVYNGNGTGRVYLDGVDVTTDGTVGNLVASATRFRMGQQTWGGEPWQGAIDEIRVSPAARSAAWVRAQNLSMRDGMLTYATPEGEGIGSSLSASASLFLAPKTVNITAASVPAGLTLTLGAVTDVAPFTETVIQNSEQQVSAALSQTVGSFTYSFSGWSDGGADTHIFHAPAADMTITATYTQGAVNTPPSVSITSPADGAVIPAPGPVTVSATASDAETSVQRVEFYVDGALVATDFDAPYSTSWNATAGAHNLSAVAFDATSVSGSSAPVGVTVQAANLPPTASITSPTNGAVIAAPGAVTISANASDPEGALTRVDFYVDGALVGSDATSPYSVSWNATAGSHSLTATAVDAGSLTGNAAPVGVTVNSGGGGTGGWFDPAWTRRAQLVLNNSGQAETLANFQVLVTLTPARFSYADAKVDGSDLRFTDASGVLIPHEIESWTPGGTSYVWVRVPSIAANSASGYVYLYYGNPSATSTADGAAVWSGYGAVWHLDGDAQDSTANANHGTQSATTTTGGLAGSSLYFNGAAYVDVLTPVNLGITGTLTGEAWIRIDDPNQAGNPRVFDKKASPWTSSAGYTLQYKPGQNNITGLGGGDNLLRANNIDLDTSWHYLVTVYNGNGTGRVYLDGVDVTSDGSVGNLVASATRFRMGQQTWGGEAWLGAIDEVRISPAARSADWVRAQNRSMRDTFIAYGATETGGGGGSNTPPTVSITSPADGAVIAAPGLVTVTANAGDTEGPVQRVEFYDGATLLGTDYASPWSVDWSATAGAHSLTARAYDAGNLSTTSTPVAVTVNGPPNQAPSATITSPANGAVIPAPGAVTITATASDPENALARVDFYVDGSLVGTDATAPYSVSWSATAGGHSLTATAVDAGNLSGTSPPVSVSVTAANQPPTVSITSPANNAVIPAPGAVTISANASDPEGALSRVDFYVDGSLVGTDSSAPYSVGWTATAGGHTLTATAVDLPGASTTSSPVNVTVNAASGTWWNPAWTRRVQLTLNNSGQAETLADFQLLVTLTSARISYADTLAGGADIRFTDSAGNPLSHEIESWNAGGTSTVWVRVPSISASSSTGYIYMYYGNPAATAAENAAGTWGGYGAVWHLDGDAVDSTANGNNGTQVATSTAAGNTGSALYFNGSAYVDVLAPTNLAITGTLTLEAWIKADDPNQAGNPRIFDKKAQPWTSAAGYCLQYKPGQNNITALGGNDNLLRANNIDLDTNWHYLAAVYNGNGTGRVYLNGVDVTSDGTVGALVASATSLRMGQQNGGGEAWRGAIDEIRINPSARSAAWIRAQNLSMRDSFIAYGAPENAP